MLKTKIDRRGLTTAGLCIGILAALCVPAIAQESDADEIRDKRLNVALQLKADVFRLNNKMFTRPDIRGESYQDITEIQWPLSNIDYYTDDSYVDLSYNASNYGGNVRLTNSTIANGQFGLLKGWVQFGVVRVSVGNVIGSTYADVLGSDQKLRIYTGKNKNDVVGWTEYKTPDNITGDEGVLIETFLNPFTFAVAGGNFVSKNGWELINGTNKFGSKDSFDIRYGARVGYEMGTLGKLNASYIVEGKKVLDAHGFNRAQTEIVPKQANAEYYDHQFGLFGTLRLTANAELTVGYVGALTAYLNEFYSQSQDAMVETGYPLVFRNGLNLNARIKASPLTLRTDNCLTFWEDQNYNLFETGNTYGWKDVGLEPKSTAENYAAITHFVMWNGFGLSYPLMEKVALTSYLRNLFSMYTAEGNGPTASGAYKFIRDEVTFDFGVSLAYNANIEAFVKLGLGYKITYRSRDLNSQTPGAFISYINNNVSDGVPGPVETLDHVLSLSIPIGISVKY